MALTTIQIDLEIPPDCQARDPSGADFVLNIQAAGTAHQQVCAEHLIVGRQVTQEVVVDSARDQLTRRSGPPEPYRMSSGDASR